jgi:hypothetical protein
MPWISEEWSPEMEPSLKGHEYAPNAAAILAYKERTNSFFQDGNSVQRFTEGFGDNYPVR